MKLEIDPDVKAVAEFMQRNVSGYRLCRVANAVAAIAPLLWSMHGEQPEVEPLRPLQLDEEAFIASGT